MNPTISYVSTVADDRNATRLTVSPEGVGVLVIGSNRDARTRPIGRFQTRLPADLVARLTAAVAAPAFAAAASQPSLVPDESYRRIQVAWSNDSPVAKLAGEQIETPPAFAVAESALREVIAVLVRSPVGALGLTLAPLPEQVQSGTPAPVELVLANPSPLAYRIPAPALWGQRASSGELSAIRTDIPAAERKLGDQHFIQLTAGDFAAAAPPIQGTAILLPPGERLHLRFLPVIPWPPGQYGIEVTLAVTAVGDDGQTLFTGALATAPGTLRVVAP